jgi:A/G-specific adenine glycosylase
MLQQTRVETVLRYYAPFLDRFPTVEALAASSEDEVMKAWEGLGYYRRARLLRMGAEHLAVHGLPNTRLAWSRVPGVGAYTAGAIASLCYGEPVAAVDGNVLRVFSRLAPFEHDITTQKAKRTAEAWVLSNQPRDLAGPFNEAIMELGATVCTPSKHQCDACPVRSACSSRGREDLPRKLAKPEPREVEVALAVCWRGGRLLLEKRETGLLAGTWGLPWVEGGCDALAAHVEHLVGTDVQVVPDMLTSTSHAFTHRRWRMRAYRVTTRGRGGEWRDPCEVALGSAHRKVLAKLEDLQ